MVLGEGVSYWGTGPTLTNDPAYPSILAVHAGLWLAGVQTEGAVVSTFGVMTEGVEVSTVGVMTDVTNVQVVRKTTYEIGRAHV